MVLNTLIYIALVIIVIIVIVVLLRFLFGVLFMLPATLDLPADMLVFTKGIFNWLEEINRINMYRPIILILYNKVTL